MEADYYAAAIADAVVEADSGVAATVVVVVAILYVAVAIVVVVSTVVVVVAIVFVAAALAVVVSTAGAAEGQGWHVVAIADVGEGEEQACFADAIVVVAGAIAEAPACSAPAAVC